jgi:hypothetical protein
MKNGHPSGYDCCYHTTNHSYQKDRRGVKISKTAVHWKGPAMPEVQFEEDQQLTSFADLLIFARLFERFTELWIPVQVIISNHQMSAGTVVALRNGRGAQEAIFAELKSHAHKDYIPSDRLAANQTFLVSAILAHNLNRELQMSASEPARATTEQRQPWWNFFRAWDAS